MSCISSSTSVEIELEDSEKETLVRGYKILKNISDDMYREDLEGTEEAFEVSEAKENLQRFLDSSGIDYSD